MQVFFLRFSVKSQKIKALFLKRHMITCIVKDSSGNELGRFEPKGEKNLLDEAAEQNIDFPFSCHAGACMSCSAKVISGQDLLDEEKDGPKYIETDEDTILTCIAGVDTEKVADAEEHVLEIELLS
jgi:ferredoxin